MQSGLTLRNAQIRHGVAPGEGRGRPEWRARHFKDLRQRGAVGGPAGETRAAHQLARTARPAPQGIREDVVAMTPTPP